MFLSDFECCGFFKCSHYGYTFCSFCADLNVLFTFKLRGMIHVTSWNNKLRERVRREDALGWPVFGSGAGFVSEAMVKGLQCSGPQGASHTLKPQFVLVAPLISGNCLSLASLSLCFVSSLHFCFLLSCCCCHYSWFSLSGHLLHSK